MLFSIVVPVYGVEKFLSQCIESILAQSFTDFELILVDDGSVDQSGSICDYYQKIDHRIQVIHKKNGGLVSARKAGLERAYGDYVLPIDGDDWIADTLLEKLAGVIKSNPGIDVICYGHYRGYSEDGYQSVKIPYSSGMYQQAQICHQFFPKLIKGKDGKRFPPNIWGKAMRRQLYKKKQEAVPNEISLGEDAAVTYPLISQAHSIYIMKECFYYYRFNPNSMTKSRKKGFDWNNLRLLAEVWKKNLNPNYDFGPQIARYMCHDLFNIAKSHLQTKLPYDVVKKSIVRELERPEFRAYVLNAHFDTFSKEQIPRILLKYKLIFCIKVLSKYI